MARVWTTRREPSTYAPMAVAVGLLCGNAPLGCTILGDPDRPEEGWPDFPARYLNTRIWQVPEEGAITVDVPTSPDKNNWPRSEPDTVELLGKSGIARRPI